MLNRCGLIFLLLFISAASFSAEKEQPKKQTEAADSPGKCFAAKSPQKTICKPDEAFLCVNTPESGVVGDYIIVKGIIQRKSLNNERVPISSLDVSVQHEYTKESNRLSKYKEVETGCWDVEPTSNAPLCLDKNGYFSARVPLNLAGPYAIEVSASAMKGEGTKKSLKTSRVIKPSLKGLEFLPNVEVVKEISEPYVSVTVNLLGDCKACDFIGASTNAVTVSVKNNILDDQGKSKNVTCTTDVEEQGQGRFRISVPVGNGKNALEVRACNAANGNECPILKNVQFNSKGKSAVFEYISPPAEPIYDSSKYPTLPLKFKWSVLNKNDCVNISLNSAIPQEVCPDDQGAFSYEVRPSVGINIVSIQPKETKVSPVSWVFGWGAISRSDEADDNLSVSISKSSIENMILPAINSYIASGELQEQLNKLAGLALSGGGDEKSKLNVGLSAAPKVGKARIEDLKLSSDEISFSLNLDDVIIYLDLGGNGKEPIPLFASFATLKIDLILKKSTDGGRVVFQVTSPHTDCDFKEKTLFSSCKNVPTPIIPQNFLGNATTFGSYLICKAPPGRTLSAEMDKICRDFNLLDDTGLLREKVLDTFNSTICEKGSSAINDFLKKGTKFNFKYNDFSFPLLISSKTGISVSPNGLTVAAAVGGEGSGVVIKNPTSFLGYHLPLKGDLSVEILTDLVNRLLHLIVQGEDGKGLLDLNVDETFFDRIGYNFIENCDVMEPPDSLCSVIRPRVSEFLGSTLTEYGYFDKKHPLQMRVRPLRILTPRISVVDDRILQVQLGGVLLHFYELEVDRTKGTDKYGNWTLKLDLEGKPITKGLIITAELNLLLGLEISGPKTHSSDPASATVGIRIVPDKSKLLIRPIPGSNSTTAPDESLVKDLEEVLKLALKMYSDPEKTIWLKIPKNIDVPGFKKISLDLERSDFQFLTVEDAMEINLGLSGL